MLVLTRRTDESVLIGDQEVVIRILEIRGNRVRIGIEAPPDVNIRRDDAAKRTVGSSAELVLAHH